MIHNLLKISWIWGFNVEYTIITESKWSSLKIRSVNLNRDHFSEINRSLDWNYTILYLKVNDRLNNTIHDFKSIRSFERKLQSKDRPILMIANCPPMITDFQSRSSFVSQDRLLTVKTIFTQSRSYSVSQDPLLQEDRIISSNIYYQSRSYNFS